MTKTPKEPKEPKVPMSKEERAARKAAKAASLLAADDLIAAGQPEDRTVEQDRMALRKKVENFYDIQETKLQVQGRILPKGKENEVVLSEFDKAILMRRVRELEKNEKNALSDVSAHLATIPFYSDVLSDKVRYRGIGPTMAGVVLASFQFERQIYATQAWSFAGLAPVPARRCRECWYLVEQDEKTQAFKHMVGPNEKKYWKCSIGNEGLTEDHLDRGGGRAMRPEKGEKSPYARWLKTKMVGVLGPVLLKVGSPWRKFYDDYKHRKEVQGWGKSDAHRHQAANRYMIKMLIMQLWLDYRSYHGLPITASYGEQKLGLHGYEGGVGRQPCEELDFEIIAKGEPTKRPTPAVQKDLHDAAIEAELALLAG